jgi:hypothetical protein
MELKDLSRLRSRNGQDIIAIVAERAPSLCDGFDVGALVKVIMET